MVLIPTQSALAFATVELDKQVYTWTDIVYITIVAPICNTNPNIIDIIGDGNCGIITIKTSKGQLQSYSLFETGPNTGIFTGKVTLDGTGYVSGITKGTGFTDGLIDTSYNDNIQVTFTRGSEGVTGSAVISSSPPSSFAYTTLPITVLTDKLLYNDGDQLTISGTVGDSTAGKSVSVIVRNPIGIIMYVAQVDLGSDRTYSTTITVGGNSSWQAAGTYEVDVQYGSNDVSAKTTFQFSGSNGGTLSGNTQQIPTPTISVSTDKTSYNYGDLITISGHASNMIQGIPLIIIFQGQNSEVHLGQVNVNSDGSFSEQVYASGSLWTNATNHYTVTAHYGSYTTYGSTFYFNGNNGQPIPLATTLFQSKIPSWIKNIFIWYGKGSISDDELLGAIKFLIQQGIIKLN
jgi:hypothetical protein